MKTFKYILSILLFFSAIRLIAENHFLACIASTILALIIFPPISHVMTLKSNFWKIKHWRYITYMLIFLVFAFSLPKKAKLQQKGDSKTTEQKEIKNKTHNPKQDILSNCNYGGGEYLVIPELVAADIYLNFEKRGFKIDKQIDTDHTNILCTLDDNNVRYNVMIVGCSPEQIIKVTATALDYSGKKQKEVSDFFGFVSTIQYKGAEPEKAKKWAKNSYNISNSSTTIGDVKMSINFKQLNSKTLSIVAAK